MTACDQFLILRSKTVTFIRVQQSFGYVVANSEFCFFHGRGFYWGKVRFFCIKCQTDLVEKNGLKRFWVDHKKHEKSLDLSQFGDGLQHIFRTILRFATAKNGVVLIDEIGTAIHHSLMKTYAKFIQKLAEKFNTQVFTTTHSGEIIDAFINNNYKNEEISMYHVEMVEGKASYKFIKGDEYKKLNNLIGLDLRD